MSDVEMSHSGDSDNGELDLEEEETSVAEAVVAAVPPYRLPPPDELHRCLGWDFHIASKSGSVAFRSDGGGSTRADALSVLRFMCNESRTHMRIAQYPMPPDERVSHDLIFNVAMWAEGRHGEVTLDEFRHQRRTLLPDQRNKCHYASALLQLGWSAAEAEELLTRKQKDQQNKRKVTLGLDPAIRYTKRTRRDPGVDGRKQPKSAAHRVKIGAGLREAHRRRRSDQMSVSPEFSAPRAPTASKAGSSVGDERSPCT